MLLHGFFYLPSYSDDLLAANIELSAYISEISIGHVIFLREMLNRL